MMRCFLATLLLLFSISSHAQYYSEWIHLQDQKMLINPAFTAFDDQREVKLFTKQLFGDDANKNQDILLYRDNELYLISSELPLRKNKDGVGISVQYSHYINSVPADGINEDSEEQKSFLADLFYSYQFADKWKVGASAGILSYKRQYDDFFLSHPQPVTDQAISFSGSLGILYSYRHWNMGIGYNRLNDPLVKLRIHNKGRLYDFGKYKPNLNFSIDYRNQLRRYRNYLSKSDWEIRVLTVLATYMTYDNAKLDIFNFTISPRLYYKFLHAGFTYQIGDSKWNRLGITAGGSILKDRLTVSLGYDFFSLQSNNTGLFGKRNLEAFLKIKF